MTRRSNHRARESRAWQGRPNRSTWTATAVLALAITAGDVGAQLAWNEVPPSGIRAASNAAMAFDAARGRMMLFGGGDVTGPIAQTLQWEGTRWAQLFPASSPSAREGHDMAYDAARDRVVLFGGARSVRSDETWEWDGTNWTKATPASRPSARGGHAMVYDAARGRVVLFGGHDGSRRGDTWEYDGVTWTQRFPATSPTAQRP